jgi:hypothetical protein
VLFVLGVFAWLALALTAVGIYGVVAYTAARRTREIAVKLALGADRCWIVALVLREGAAWATGDWWPALPRRWCYRGFCVPCSSTSGHRIR